MDDPPRLPSSAAGRECLATHDIEHAMYGTSLGVDLDHGNPVEAGHEHHLRAINRIRRAGGIQAAVEQGLLTQGIMHECVRNDIPFLLAGSIRDDGPLPEVVTDVVDVRRRSASTGRRQLLPDDRDHVAFGRGR